VPRPPSFKQEKRRREDAQKGRNQEKQQQKAARKVGEREGQNDHSEIESSQRERFLPARRSFNRSIMS
jgi:hypothetical protein